MIITGHAWLFCINIEINKDSQIVDTEDQWTFKLLKFYLIYHKCYHGGSSRNILQRNIWNDFCWKKFFFFIKKYLCQYWNTFSFYSKFTDIIMPTLQFSRYERLICIATEKSLCYTYRPIQKHALMLWCHLIQYRFTNK